MLMWMKALANLWQKGTMNRSFNQLILHELLSKQPKTQLAAVPISN